MSDENAVTVIRYAISEWRGDHLEPTKRAIDLADHIISSLSDHGYHIVTEWELTHEMSSGL